MNTYIHSFREISNDFSGVNIPSLLKTSFGDSLLPSLQTLFMIFFYPSFTLDELKFNYCNVEPKSSPDLDKISLSLIFIIQSPLQAFYFTS